jgi:hypothetical protein
MKQVGSGGHCRSIPPVSVCVYFKPGWNWQRSGFNSGEFSRVTLSLRGNLVIKIINRRGWDSAKRRSCGTATDRPLGVHQTRGQSQALLRLDLLQVGPDKTGHIVAPRINLPHFSLHVIPAFASASSPLFSKLSKKSQHFRTLDLQK